MNLKKIKFFWPAIFPLILISLGITIIFFAFYSKPSNVSQSAEFSQSEAELAKTSDQSSTLGSEDVTPKGEFFRVTRVVDGDTIEIEGGQTVRYIGIDTPETVHPQKTVECFGREASNKNKELVEGKFVQLEKDVSETDKYGRLLRYVYADGVFVNELLVKEGFAHASSYPPDIKYQDLINSAQEEARSHNKGLWAGCQEGKSDTSQNQEGCVIKGNISFSTGEKIYHVPGQEYYDKTAVDESKGERWFCTEEEAQNAGWRISKK